MTAHASAMPSSLRQLDRRVDEDLVLLHARLGLVLFVDELERAFAEKLAWQDHHADEAARPVGGLREHRVGPGLVPGAARAVADRVARRVDADAAVEQAADAGTPVLVQERAA